MISHHAATWWLIKEDAQLSLHPHSFLEAAHRIWKTSLRVCATLSTQMSSTSEAIIDAELTLRWETVQRLLMFPRSRSVPVPKTYA